MLHCAASPVPTWEYLGPGFGFRDYSGFCVTEHAIYVGPIDEDNVTGYGLYHYAFDEGEWNQIGFPGLIVIGIGVWGANDESLCVTVVDEWNPAGTWRSTDGGKSWVEVMEGVSYQPLVQSPVDNSRMIMARLFSTDAGATWAIGAGGPGSGGSFTGQAFDPSIGPLAYMTGEHGFEAYWKVYKTANGGAEWSELWISQHNFGPKVMGVSVDWKDTRRIMVGRGEASGVLITGDGGETWEWIASPHVVRELCSAPWGIGHFAAGGDDPDAGVYEVWWTGDLGATWTPLNDGLPVLPSTVWTSWTQLAAHPVEPILFAALEPTGVWRLDLSDLSGVESGPSDLLSPGFVTYPNPSNGDMTIAFAGASGLPMRSLRVVDVMGRVVQTLQGGADQTTLRWDGRDHAGREVASGVYVVYLRPDGRVGGSQRVLILR